MAFFIPARSWTPFTRGTLTELSAFEEDILYDSGEGDIGHDGFVSFTDIGPREKPEHFIRPISEYKLSLAHPKEFRHLFTKFSGRTVRVKEELPIPFLQPADDLRGAAVDIFIFR